MKKNTFWILKWALRHFMCFLCVVFSWMIIIYWGMLGCNMINSKLIAGIFTAIVALIYREVLYRMEYNCAKKYDTYRELDSGMEKILFYVFVMIFSVILFVVRMKWNSIYISLKDDNWIFELIESGIVNCGLFMNVYMHLTFPLQYALKYGCKRTETSGSSYLAYRGYFGAGFCITWIPFIVYIAVIF